MEYKFLYNIIRIVIFYLLIVNYNYSQSIQSPDDKLIFNLKDDCGKKIEFEDLTYSYNDELVISDISNQYSAVLKGFKKNDIGSVTNLKMKNETGISYFELAIGWSSLVVLEIRKKSKNKLDTMNVYFENIYQLSPIIEIKFKRGNYSLNVKEIIQNEKNKKGYSNQYIINPKYLKKVKRKYEIYLKKVITNKIKVGYEYQLVNPKDTAYVLVERSGDFGIVHSTYFVLKDNLPDGEYKIYVEDTLRQIGYYKNGLKDNRWIEYRENNEKQVTEYSNGKIKSVLEYFPDGSLKSESCFNSKGIKRRIIYYNSGEIKMKEYFYENKQYKIKKFDKEGKLIETIKIKN